MFKIIATTNEALDFSIGPAMRHITRLVQKNFKYPHNYKFTTTSKHWQSYGFGIKSKGKPSASIKSLMRSENKFDCERTALSICLYNILKQIGDNDFDSKIKGELRITAQGNFQSVQIALRNMIEVCYLNDFSEIVVGDWLYFENSPSYLENNRGGYASGEHVICSSVKPLRFIGLLDKSLPLTYEEWLNVLYSNSEGIDFKDIKGVYKHDGKIVVKRYLNSRPT